MWHVAAALDPVQLFRRATGLDPDDWQKQLLRSQSKHLIALTCRQAGKSTATAALALWTALYEAGSLILLLAPAERQAVELLLKICEMYVTLGEPIPAVKATARELKLINGSRILALPGSNERTIRGFSGAALLIVDEASRVDDDLYYSVRPMLAVSGGRLALLSTPFGMRGVFFDVWRNGTGWDRFKVLAPDCPRITQEFLADERRSMGPRWFQQEYMCSFEHAEGAVFSHETIEAARSGNVAPLFDRPLFGRRQSHQSEVIV